MNQRKLIGREEETGLASSPPHGIETGEGRRNQGGPSSNQDLPKRSEEQHPSRGLQLEGTKGGRFSKS